MNEQLEILLPTAVTHGFDYLAPAGMHLQPGDIVSVPIGSGQSLGVVWGKGTAKIASGKIKSVAQHHAQFPPLSDAMREFIDWAAWYNCAPKGAMLKMVLPIADIDKQGRVKKSLHPLPMAGGMSAFSHREKGGDSRDEGFNLALLSAMQQKAADQLTKKIGEGFSVTLLDGVTGSGKTEVYFAAMAAALQGHMAIGLWLKENSKPEALSLKPQILVLLPEIALSVQWLERFEQRFGVRPLVWNSEITPARKRAGWQAIAKGDARIIIGARSALFLPYKNLSLIVVDEEHDGSYKQEDGVIYHARDMAVARARFEKLPVILVSATPSLESYHNAQTGKYSELSLPTRHGEAELPDIEMVDMRKTLLERGAFVSEPLRKALAAAISHGHQAMLFLNRRGYAPLVLCRTCGHRFQCPQCSAWMVQHRSKPRLECHHCGYRIPVPEKCPDCGGEGTLHACGPGVERLAEEVAAFMPGARVAVMASDHIENYQMLSDTITAMSEKRIDLMIGTQMIAKGHHFADLAVVGVVDADLGLGGGDLRAAEHTYQLLHQLSGRAGRETVAGKVYLQSYLPEHPVMKALLSGDRNAFLGAELQARQNANMPPFTRLAAVIIEGHKEELVIRTAKQLAANAPSHSRPLAPLPLEGEGKGGGGLQTWGPSPAPLYMLRGKYRYRFLVKAQRAINLPDYMRGWVDSVKAPSSVRIKIDMDPMGFL